MKGTPIALVVVMVCTAIAQDATAQPWLGPWQQTKACPRDWWGFGDWSATAYDGRLYVIGSTQTPGTWQCGQSWMADLAADGSVQAWSQVSTSSVSRGGAGSAVAVNGYMYTVGGVEGHGPVIDKVEYAPVNPDGTLGTWAPTASLSVPCYRAGAVAWNNRLYLVGGAQSHSGPWLDTVQVADIQPDGSLGAWRVDPSTMNAAHPQNAAVVKDGWLYSISGGYNAYRTAVVERAEVLSDGSLGPWTLENPLPTGVACSGATIIGDYLFVAGGHTGTYGNGKTDGVWSVRINSDHSLGEWREDRDLPFEDHCTALTVGDYVYVLSMPEDGSRPTPQGTYYAIPEPAALALLAVGGLALLGRKRG